MNKPDEAFKVKLRATLVAVNCAVTVAKETQGHVKELISMARKSMVDEVEFDELLAKISLEARDSLNQHISSKVNK